MTAATGCCKVTELDDLAPFLVDEAEAEAMGLQTIPSEKDEAAAVAGAAATSNGTGEGSARFEFRSAVLDTLALHWRCFGVFGSERRYQSTRRGAALVESKVTEGLCCSLFAATTETAQLN
jgi:hypothetical protein